ncbi:nitroreductase [Piscinibacter koreensis]|uniref:Nitroreductase n=1 Tax=Piscinibacter koreensis TaxID=2742824 RepID=A0A7Y6NK77_9BURK|nr:nitroreductase [Schlegelella koreensis]NUZ04735.1 nitroreductase [Schlegelella koreensis]
MRRDTESGTEPGADVTASGDRLPALAALLAERGSCRGFRPDPVPHATIERILAAAQRTASWCNAQPWRVHLLSGAAIEAAREALPRHAEAHAPDPDFAWPAEYQGIYLERRRRCGFQLYEAVGVARGDRAGGARQAAENFRLFGAPHVALVTTDRELGVYGAVDCGAWVSTFMLAARAAGVASIAQAALAAYPGFWRGRLGIRSDRLVVCGVSFGYADPAHPANAFRTERAALGEVVEWVSDAPAAPPAPAA